MKINKIKFVFGLAAMVAFLAVGCQQEQDPTANLSEEQKASLSDEEKSSQQDMENYDSGSSPDDRKE
jgi:PBP1b-binding outer membrane lipoprotein LpoB